ncbi:Flp family type IVb pilin [Streptomyces sp. NPDC093600]|uniref:Flp family type IVb pilin n=1 Tax=Streptomyces sp. NPDC093600 TaxID=3366047 RepID=UPI00382F0B24
MNDLMLKTVARTRVYVGNWARTASKDRGQTAVEYLGIIVVVVAIVIAISGTSIGQDIKNAISTKIASLTGGGGGE